MLLHPGRYSHCSTLSNMSSVQQLTFTSQSSVMHLIAGPADVGSPASACSPCLGTAAPADVANMMVLLRAGLMGP